jgi:lactoylglutathione lyase
MASSHSQSLKSPFPEGEYLPNGLKNEPPLAPNDPTIGYKLNHAMLRIKDPSRSLNFYVNLMGMRTVFVQNTGPYTIYYLGYPQTDAHRADPVVYATETMPVIPQTLGLLELCHIHGSENEPDGYYTTGNQPPQLGFGHLGFTVPDVSATIERLKNNGVEVFKDLGIANRESVPLSQWEAQRGIGVGDLHAIYRAVQAQLAFVKDPVCCHQFFEL